MSSPFDDPALLEKLQARHEPSQSALWKLMRPQLVATVTPIVGGKAVAEAVVADLLSDFLFHYVNKLRDGRAIPSYLRIMALRRSRRQQERARRHGELDPDDRRHRSDDAGPDDAIDSARWSRWLERCLGEVKGKARSILKLHYGHEMSYAEIGQRLGTSKQAAAKMGKKYLEVLRACVETQARGEHV